MKRNNNFREMISGENGVISSKRVMGVVVLAVCMLCTCWLVWSEGGTTVVENLLQTLMIMSAALLGISSITSIWKKGTSAETAKTVEEVTKEDPPKFDPEDPCKNCIHNTKKAAE
jgi:ABC-type nickel/cobalt efflux system permease component RcnA